MNGRPLTFVFTFMLCCLLGGCGFQLRGTGNSRTTLPTQWQSFHLVTSNPNSEFTQAVITQFAANGVQWSDRASANYMLILNSEQFRQRNLSLNSEARAAELELTMSTKFTVLSADSKVAMEETKVAVIKEMENDPRNVVGKAEEIRLLQDEMRLELAQQVLRRIGFFAASTTAKSQAQPATP